jgi:hypothetical protein
MVAPIAEVRVGHSRADDVNALVATTEWTIRNGVPGTVTRTALTMLWVPAGWPNPLPAIPHVTWGLSACMAFEGEVSDAK